MSQFRQISDFARFSLGGYGRQASVILLLILIGSILESCSLLAMIPLLKLIGTNQGAAQSSIQLPWIGSISLGWLLTAMLCLMIFQALVSRRASSS